MYNSTYMTLDNLFVLQLILAQDKYSTLDLMHCFQVSANHAGSTTCLYLYGARNKLQVNGQLATEPETRRSKGAM
jgi:hypothetical protein